MGKPLGFLVVFDVVYCDFFVVFVGFLWMVCCVFNRFFVGFDGNTSWFLLGF